MNKYYKWLDDLKGIAIVLIVLGHVVATIMNMSSNQVVNGTFEWIFHAIYSFHVQLFFFIAGITFSCKDPYWIFIKKKFMRLMVPYYAWGFASAVLFLAMGRVISWNIADAAVAGTFSSKITDNIWWTPLISIIHAGGWPNGKGFCFNGVLWFLPVMFIAQLIFYWVAKFVRGGGLFLAFALFFVLLLYENPLIYGFRMPYGITWVPKYLPYLALGRWYNEIFLSQRNSFRCKDYIIALITIGYGLFCFLIPDMALGDVRRYVSEVLIASVMVVFMVWLAKKGAFRVFAIFAPFSIGIMLVHKFPLVILQLIMGKFKVLLESLSSSVVLCLMITAVLMWCCYYFSRLIVYFMPWCMGVRGRR